MENREKAVPRYCPNRPLPKIAFLPGVHPHPINHPRGHLRGLVREPIWIPANQWKRDKAYLYGVDCYHRGYFWEAHESWEGIWLLARTRDATKANMIKGLIQCAAACLHLSMGKRPTFENVSERALGYLHKAAAERKFLMGLDLCALSEAWRSYRESPGPEMRPLLILKDQNGADQKS